MNGNLMSIRLYLKQKRKKNSYLKPRIDLDEIYKQRHGRLNIPISHREPNPLRRQPEARVGVLQAWSDQNSGSVLGCSCFKKQKLDVSG
jgi:hypothetical protein